MFLSAQSYAHGKYLVNSYHDSCVVLLALQTEVEESIGVSLQSEFS